MRKIDEIIIHCFATPLNWMAGKTFAEKVAEVKRWHLARRFTDIGYHYMLSRKGEVVAGRPLSKAGAHAKGHNANSIGISLEGGKDGNRGDAFLDNFTSAQGTALLNLIESLQKEFGPLKVTGHHYYANKECPCFNVVGFLSQTPVEAVKPKFKPTKTTVGIGGLAMMIALFFDKIEAFWKGLF